MMRILWFTGVQLPAVTGKDLSRAGWQEGLRRALNHYYPDLQLIIASFGTETYQPFSVENATYYNIYRKPVPNSRWKRIIKNWKHKPFDQEELNRCFDLYEQVKPDLVFIFGTENPFGLLSNRFDVPAVISIQAVFQGLVLRLFSGLSTLELLKEFFSKDTVLGKGPFHRWWTLKKYSRIEEKIYHRCQYFTGRTDWDRSWLNRLNPNATYFHIDRVLGDNYYHVNWNFPDSQENLIFSVSSNASFKGGITLVRALAELKSRGFEDIQLRLAGIDQASNIGKHISRIVKIHELHHQISMLGRLSQADIVAEMLKARLFVLPSHMDNSPNSLAQAMILGMPCLASDAGGIPSMLRDNEEGILYHHNDINALADQIERFFCEPDRALKLSIQARKTAQVRHDPERIAREMYLTYQEVLSRSSK